LEEEEEGKDLLPNKLFALDMSLRKIPGRLSLLLGEMFCSLPRLGGIISRVTFRGEGDVSTTETLSGITLG